MLSLEFPKAPRSIHASLKWIHTICNVQELLMVSGFTCYVLDYEVVFPVPCMVIFKWSSWIISPHSPQREENASSLPACVCMSPSLSWQPLKQINFKLMLQFRSNSCPPWLPNTSQESQVIASPGDSSASLPFLVAAQRNPKAACDCFLVCHERHEAKGISLPHISPTGPWKRRMQRRNCKLAACCMSPFSVSPGTGWNIHGSVPSPCPSARSSRMQMLVRPSLPMLGGSLDKTSWRLCPLGHQSVAQEWIGDVS